MYERRVSGAGGDEKSERLDFGKLTRSRWVALGIDITSSIALLESMMGGKRKRNSGDGGVMDANAAMKKSLSYVPPDQIFMTGQLNR